jgi:hypothetical protein
VDGLGTNFTYATKFFRKLRGGSQPILAQASDGQIYVLKFTNNPQGSDLQFNDSMGTELYFTCHLPVPAWKAVMITDSFIDENRSCWIQTAEGTVRPSAGICFGSRFLGCNEDRLFEVLPGNSFLRVRNFEDFWLAWLIDICAEHPDNRQAIFRQDGTGQFQAVFIDQGSMFAGPNGNVHPLPWASRYLDSRIYQNVSASFMMHARGLQKNLRTDQMWQTVRALPREWKTETALRGFALCLERLSNSRLLLSIVESMVEYHLRANAREQNEIKCGRRPANSFLRLGVQVAELGRGAVA